jgi:hypothetical protein
MLRNTLILLGFAVAVWAFCGAIMGLGPLVMSLNATLVVHAIGGPAGAALAAWLYARHFGAFSPVVVAASFVATALVLDFGLVASVFMRSYEMFASVAGLWLPMALIFTAAFLAGNRAGATA